MYRSLVQRHSRVEANSIGPAHLPPGQTLSLTGILLANMPRRGAYSTDLESPSQLPVPRTAARPRRRDRKPSGSLGPSYVGAMVFLGVLAALFLQPRHSLSEYADIASSAAASATAKASGLFQNSKPFTPYHDHYDHIEKIWQAANKHRRKKLAPPETQAHKFESKRWYSERLHPAAIGLRPTWIRVISGFMKDMPISSFSSEDIVTHYNMNANNVQNNCVLVRIQDGRATFEKKFSNTKHGRYSSVVYMIESILSEESHGIPDMTFLVMLNDGHQALVPTFGAARHWDSWVYQIPAPMGNTRGESEGWGTPLQGWDRYIAETVKNRHIDYPWDTKIKRAVFRGALQMQTYKLGSCNVENQGKCTIAKRWSDVNRGAMYKRAQSRPDLFDITFTKHRTRDSAGLNQMKGAPRVGESIDFSDLQKFKYVLNVGSNQDWAERLRSLLFMNSAVVLHMAEAKEFFTPLLEPWKHIIPANLMFTDLVRNVKWAVGHDKDVRKIVQNMNKFADFYVNERSMKLYWRLALFEYSTRQQLAAASGSDEAQEHVEEENHNAAPNTRFPISDDMKNREIEFPKRKPKRKRDISTKKSQMEQKKEKEVGRSDPGEENMDFTRDGESTAKKPPSESLVDGEHRQVIPNGNGTLST